MVSCDGDELEVLKQVLMHSNLHDNVVIHSNMQTVLFITNKLFKMISTTFMTMLSLINRCSCQYMYSDYLFIEIKQNMIRFVTHGITYSSPQINFSSDKFLSINQQIYLCHTMLPPHQSSVSQERLVLLYHKLNGIHRITWHIWTRIHKKSVIIQEEMSFNTQFKLFLYFFFHIFSFFFILFFFGHVFHKGQMETVF